MFYKEWFKKDVEIVKTFNIMTGHFLNQNLISKTLKSMNKLCFMQYNSIINDVGNSVKNNLNLFKRILISQYFCSFCTLLRCRIVL